MGRRGGRETAEKLGDAASAPGSGRAGRVWVGVEVSDAAGDGEDGGKSRGGRCEEPAEVSHADSVSGRRVPSARCAVDLESGDAAWPCQGRRSGTSGSATSASRVRELSGAICG